MISWNGAFLYDSTAGAETVIQLLEYANSQLLEFRHYDELLTRELASVYDFMENGSMGILARWRTAKRASRLHTVLLDVGELTERADNAIKFLSDMFSARLYKVAANKIGVTDYKNLVNEKVHTAEELYRFMVDQFHQSRAFVLEVLVVIILVIELIWLFKGSVSIVRATSASRKPRGVGHPGRPPSKTTWARPLVSRARQASLPSAWQRIPPYASESHHCRRAQIRYSST